MIIGLQELGQGKQRLDAVVQELFSGSSAIDGVYDVMALTKAYHKYKREYVKQLVFTPDEENLSKFMYKCLILTKYSFSATLLLDQ